MPTNFHIAPPARTVDGLLAVPVDIQSIDASFTFDGSTQTASADATLTYIVGPTAGNPIFDLRQTITQAWLDGTIFPVAQLAHHAFGVEAFTDLRIIEAVQAAGSVHTLRVQYSLALPNAQLGGSYLPALDWLPGPMLRFVFGLSDLNRARYAEAWLPANLQFDQYSIDLELTIVNTMASHSVISNGAVTVLGPNHWQIAFPARFTSLSPMLEVRATDTLEQQTDTTVLPVSGATVTIEAWKPASGSVNLTTQINNIKALLADNENGYGAYAHGNRFVAFFNGSGGMEYEGGTTTSTGALLHETFHSWFARGIKPAAQADGWWDEGFTKFHDDGANDAIPFDFTDPPVLLCSRDPWQRHTPSNAYTDGSNFWKGMASLLTVNTLNGLMGSLYQGQRGNPVSTPMMEAFLLAQSGEPRVVDVFHRFIYGLPDPSPSPDLWIKDDPAHAGSDAWGGAFWDSPDLWVRNSDDGGTSHQAPEAGQDNWFYARVRNASGAGAATHFVATFRTRGFAGTEFVYPADFLPCTAAAVEFDLPPGGTRIVKARWPRALVPSAGSHSCLLASVLARGDQPVSGRHVWEHNNLAQKNLTIVDLQPDVFLILPILVSNWRRELQPRFILEVWRPHGADDLAISLVARSRELFRRADIPLKRFEPGSMTPKPPRSPRLECGGYVEAEAPDGKVLTSDRPDLLAVRFPDAWEASLRPGRVGRLPVELLPGRQLVVGLKASVSPRAKPGQTIKLHFVQRHVATKQIVGGVALEVRVAPRGGESSQRSRPR
jgi:hypothetical protein